MDLIPVGMIGKEEQQEWLKKQKKLEESGNYTVKNIGMEVTTLEYFRDGKKVATDTEYHGSRFKKEDDPRLEAKDSQGNVVFVVHRGNDPHIDYYNSEGTIGFVERSDNHKVAKKIGLYDGDEIEQRDSLRSKIDAHQKQQAMLKKKITGRKVQNG